jgi:hypothetical protein
MTQGIQHGARIHEFSPAYLARITPKVRPKVRQRQDGWFVTTLSDVIGLLVPRRVDEVPKSLLEDVGLGAASPDTELRTEFNRLDAQLHARFY